MSGSARHYAWSAYGFLREEAASLASLILPPVLAIMAVELLLAMLGVGGAGLRVFGGLVGCLILARYARVIYGGLLDGRRPVPRDLLGFDRATISVAWALLMVPLLGALPMVPSIAVLATIGTAAQGGGEASTGIMLPLFVVALAGMIGAIYIGARLMLALPIAAAGAIRRIIGGSWVLTRGSVWLIVKIVALTMLPFSLLAELIGLLVLAADNSMVGVRVPLALARAVDFAGFALAAHALVALYRDLTAATGAAPRSIPGGPSA